MQQPSLALHSTRADRPTQLNWLYRPPQAHSAFYSQYHYREVYSNLWDLVELLTARCLPSV